jgi:transcriptional regulator with XRE-family HTH domain
MMAPNSKNIARDDERNDAIKSCSYSITSCGATKFFLPEGTTLVTMQHIHGGPVLVAFSMNIGETIRNYRLQRGMSQGDIEKRTGLLRCYLSRVENGHTIPSLDTLAKIAGAMEIALSQFFSESGHSNGSKNLPQLSDDEVRFLSQIRRYAVSLNDSDRKLVLAMVKKMATK